MFITTKDAIDKLVSRSLNKEWYDKALLLFKSNIYYNPERNWIQEPLPEDFGLEVGDSDDVPFIELKTITFSSWCWQFIEDEKYQKILQFNPAGLSAVSNVWKSVEYIMDAVIKNNVDIPTQYKYMETIIGFIEEEIANLQELHPEQEYCKLLDMFLGEILYSLRFKYYHLYELYTSTESFEDKIKFNLTQEQLAALVYLINNAKLLNNDNDKEVFNRFCERHFYYLGRDGKTFNKLKQVSKKATKRNSGKNSPIEVVYDKLHQAYLNSIP